MMQFTARPNNPRRRLCVGALARIAALMTIATTLYAMSNHGWADELPLDPPVGVTIKLQLRPATPGTAATPATLTTPIAEKPPSPKPRLVDPSTSKAKTIPSALVHFEKPSASPDSPSTPAAVTQPKLAEPKQAGPQQAQRKTTGQTSADPPSLELTDSHGSDTQSVPGPKSVPSTALVPGPKSVPSTASLPSPENSKSTPMRIDAQAQLNAIPLKALGTRQELRDWDGNSKAMDRQENSTPKALRLTDKRADLDFSNEISGESDTAGPAMELQADDVPLEQEDHPFDAPAALSVLPKSPRSDAKELAPTQRDTLSARELTIKAEIQQCLSYFLANPENTTRRGPWALMHTTLPFGVESEVIAGGRRVNTIGWMSFNGLSAKQRMFQPTRTGFRPNVGPGMQGHEGQFLAILAQSNVSGEYPLQVGSRKYTVMDLAKYEMSTCREKSELTFKLIGLSYYLEPDARWRDSRGQTWSLEKMVAEELSQPVLGAACGGTHRLMGLSYAIIQRQAARKPIHGTWSRAESYLNDYVNYAMSLQNPDGSFSTNWFESRGMDADVARKVQTSGHILEWLVYTLPDDHLRSPRIQLGIEFLLSTVGREPQRDWPIGPRGHALRAMALYSQRVFGAETGKLKQYVAEVETGLSRR